MRVLTLKELDDQIRQRKAELGIAGRPSAPANSGRHRTDSKRALLQKLKDAAMAQGRELPFKARF
jgi:hypothetical protein